METRRDVLKKLGAAAVVGSSVATAAPALAKSDPAQAALDAAASTPAATLEPPWTLLAPLTAGSAIGQWTLQELSPVHDGASVVTLANDSGDLARIHICLNGGSPRGLAHTERFDLLLMNGGDGGTPSQEHLARVLSVLAGHVSSNGDAALISHPELRQLMTHDERVAAFDDAGGVILL